MQIALPDALQALAGVTNSQRDGGGVIPPLQATPREGATPFSPERAVGDFRELLTYQLQVQGHHLKVELLSRVAEGASSTVKKLTQNP